MAENQRSPLRGPAESRRRQAPVDQKSISGQRQESDRRAWEFYWRRQQQLQFDVWAVAAATAEVDRLDRVGPSPLSISFQEARAYIESRYGPLTCACHGPNRPAPVDLETWRRAS